MYEVSYYCGLKVFSSHNHIQKALLVSKMFHTGHVTHFQSYLVCRSNSSKRSLGR